MICLPHLPRKIEMKTPSGTDFKLRLKTSTNANILLKYSCSIWKKDRCTVCMTRFCPVSDSIPTQVEPSTGEVLVDLLRPEFYKDTDQAPRNRFFDLTDSMSGFQWLFLTISNLNMPRLFAKYVCHHRCIIAYGRWMMAMFHLQPLLILILFRVLCAK